MEIKKTNTYIQLKSHDENGDFVFRVLTTGCCQINLKTEDDEAYINVDNNELIAIRDIINDVLEIKNIKP